MPANTLPPFAKGPNAFTLVTMTSTITALAKSDGTGTIGTDLFKLGTAGAFGAWLASIQLSVAESTLGSVTVANTARIFISSVTSGATTNANTFNLREVALAAQTPSTTIAGVPVILPIGSPVPPNCTVLIGLGVVPAATYGWQALANLADF